MNGYSRRTIARDAAVEGIGLHLGQACRLTFRPAAVNTGVRFVRTDREGQETPASVSIAVTTDRRTQLGNGDDALHTVEHVLAAIAGSGIDDLVIEMDAAEPPIVDGSARPFVDALAGAGIVEHGGTVEILEVREPVRVQDGDSWYEALPAPNFQLDVRIEFPHALIGRQHGEWIVTRETFARELAPARTFGFVREVEQLRAMGLIQGASTSNAVVLDDAGLVDCELRWPDEFVRHKAMDCVGDLALAGARIRGRIVAHRPSHRGTILLVRELVRRAGLQVTDEESRRSLTMSEGAAATGVRGPFGIEEIMKVLPHRYPFLLVDRVLELDPGKRVVGIKNVTMNEPFFQGHFPGHPIMPGVLIVEAMAQVGGMLLLGAVEDPESKVVYFMSLDNVKFRRPVKPGDQLRFELEMIQVRGKVCRMRGVAKVDGEVVAEAEMAAMVRDR